MDPSGSETLPPNFPQRMFAVGEEPVDIRVTPYHKPSCISKIVNALEDEEIAVIRASSFGKLLVIAKKNLTVFEYSNLYRLIYICIFQQKI